MQAVAYDTPIVGWRGQHVNALRLWSARAPDPLRLDVFNTGDYLGAVAEEARAESICKFLYPNDESAAGRELRLSTVPAHGAHLLDRDPELAAALVDWLRRSLLF